MYKVGEGEWRIEKGKWRVEDRVWVVMQIISIEDEREYKQIYLEGEPI